MKRIQFILSAVYLSFVSCAPRYLPYANEFRTYPGGSIVKTEIAGVIYLGEILEHTDSALFIRILPETNKRNKKNKSYYRESNFVRLNKLDIQQARILLARSTPREAVTPILTIFNYVLPFTQSVVGILTFPTAILISTTSVHVPRGKYFFFDYPKDASWEKLKHFARFPAGMPEEIDWEGSPVSRE